MPDPGVRDDFALMVAGESGDGVLTAGELLARAFARLGYHTLTFPDYPAEIRGGPCSYRLRASSRPVHTIGETFDVLVAFNRHALEAHYARLRSDGVLAYETKEATVEPATPRTDLPFAGRARVFEALRTERPLNVYAAAYVAAKLGLSRLHLEAVVNEAFQTRPPDVRDANARALALAYDDAAQDPTRAPRRVALLAPGGAHVALNGNQAVALGALASGCQVFAGYPITPASPILDELATLLPGAGGTCVQAEDEMAALGIAIGAAWAGRRSMTATSGPGLSLMTELLGLAVMAEIPVVVCNVQRAGPATGMPTKPEQADLWSMVFSGHGETPRVVLAPTDVADAYAATQWAFEVAERYQVPVILATDAYLAHRVENVAAHELRRRRALPTPSEGNGTDYSRYRLTRDLVSPRTVPGKSAGVHLAESLEHDEHGFPSYDGTVHEAMLVKRRGKLEPLRNSPETVDEIGPASAETLLVSWGGSCGVVREVLQERSDLAGVLVRLVWPLPTRLLDRVRAARRVVVVENNPSGQLALLLEAYAHRRVERVNEARGEPLPAERVRRHLELSMEAPHG